MKFFFIYHVERLAKKMSFIPIRLKNSVWNFELFEIMLKINIWLKINCKISKNFVNE